MEPQQPFGRHLAIRDHVAKRCQISGFITTTVIDAGAASQACRRQIDKPCGKIMDVLATKLATKTVTRNRQPCRAA